MGWGIRTRLAAGTGLIAVAVVAATAQAQNQDGGVQVDLDFSQRFTWSDNADFAVNANSDFRSVTSLAVALASVTRTQQFRFSLGGSFEAGGADVLQPIAALQYIRESAGAKLDVDLSYRQSDVSDFTFTAAADDSPDLETLSLDGGQRQDLRARLAVELGRDAPFGASLSYEKRIRDFVDTVDPGLFDAQIDIASARFRFDLNPQVSVSVFANDRREDEDPGGTDRDTSQVGIALTLAFTPALEGTFQVSQDDVATTIGAAPAARNDGLSYSAGLSRALANGTLVGAVSGRITENGRRDSLTLRRALDLPGGALDVSLGGVRFPTGQTRGLWGLSLTQELPRTFWQASLSQNPSTSDSVETLNTQFALSVTHTLSPLANLSGGLQFTDIDGISADGQDASRIDLTVTYRQDIGQSWDFVSGLRHRRQDSDTDADVTANTLFFGVSKSLSWRR